ncbi:MAG: hypothetical protein O7A06_12050, partial [Acidobacteria bacterium]|nr:hypothetical protein [Acidobacteriota bacterium]
PHNGITVQGNETVAVTFGILTKYQSFGFKTWCRHDRCSDDGQLLFMLTCVRPFPVCISHDERFFSPWVLLSARSRFTHDMLELGYQNQTARGEQTPSPWLPPILWSEPPPDARLAPV